MISGLIPAIPLIIIRPFLPESPAWKQKKDAGTLKRPSFGELFAPQLRRTTIITTIMLALSFGAAFRRDPANAADRAGDARGGGGQTRQAGAGSKRKLNRRRPSGYAKVQELGGLVGRFALAMLAVRILSRRRLLRLFLVPGLFVMPLAFGYLAMNNRELFTIGSWQVTWFDIGIFLAGFFTVAQFSFWGNYLPRVYPLHLRGTGESFAANIGGRMIGTSFAAVASFFAAQSFVPGADAAQKMAFVAAAIGLVVYLANLVLSQFLPEPPTELSTD